MTNEHMERSDLFHWAQLVERVKKFILPNRRARHKEPVESLRDASNVFEVYRIFEKMKT